MPNQSTSTYTLAEEQHKQSIAWASYLSAAFPDAPDTKTPKDIGCPKCQGISTYQGKTQARFLDGKMLNIFVCPRGHMTLRRRRNHPMKIPKGLTMEGMDDPKSDNT